MRRIGLMYDYEPGQRPGGADRVLTGLINAIETVPNSDNVEIVGCTPGEVDRDCELYVMLLSKQFSDEELEFVNSRPHIRYEMDYWQAVEPQHQWRDKLNESSLWVAFASPLHLTTYMRRNPASQAISHKLRVICNPFDATPFEAIRAAHADDETPEVPAIWAGDWGWHKGVDIALKWTGATETLTDFYSPIMPQGLIGKNVGGFARCRGVGQGPDWYDTIAQHKQFIHFPRQADPFGYGCLEAYCLGLQVLCNGRIGIESFDGSFDTCLRLAAIGAQDFWGEVLNA